MNSETNKWISRREAGHIVAMDSRRVERALDGVARSRIVPFGTTKRQRQYWLPDVLRFVENQPHFEVMRS